MEEGMSCGVPFSLSIHDGKVFLSFLIVDDYDAINDFQQIPQQVSQTVITKNTLQYDTLKDKDL